MDQKSGEFSCILCNSKLESKDALQEHFRKHANKEIPSKKTKVSKPKMKNDKLFEKVPCDLCSMEFDSTTLAIQHRYRKHPENLSKHYCGFCGMQFPIKYTRDKHLPIHGSSRPEGSYPCTYCPNEFFTKTGRDYHIKSAHNRVTSIFQPVNTPLPSKKIRFNNCNEAQSVYYCYLCGSEYIVKFNLQKHLEKYHTAAERDAVPEQMIRCTTCEALFYTKKAYETHALYHKPGDLYVTSEEQRLQTVSRVDQDFDIRRVQLPTEKYIPPYKLPRKNSLKNLSEKLAQKTSNSDDDLSPISEPDSSDSESAGSLKKKFEIETQVNTDASENIKETGDVIGNNDKNLDGCENKNDEKSEQPGFISHSKHSKKGVVKKRIYAILSPDGSIKEIQKDIPKNAVLAKTNTIKLTNSDILKTLSTSTKQDESNKKVILVHNKASRQIGYEPLITPVRNNIKPIKTYGGKKKFCNKEEKKLLKDTEIEDNKSNEVFDTQEEHLSNEKNETSNKNDKPRLRVLTKELFYDKKDVDIQESSNLDQSKNNKELADSVIESKNVDNTIPKLDSKTTCTVKKSEIKENARNKSKIIKIILDRLPEKYESILRMEKNKIEGIPTSENKRIKVSTTKNNSYKKNKKRKH